MIKKLCFIITCILPVITGCDDDPFQLPYLDLSTNQVDILFVSESEGAQQIFTVQDSALKKIWGIGLPDTMKSVGYLDPAWSGDKRKFAFSNIERITIPYAPFLSNIYILNMDKDTFPSVIRITSDTIRADTNQILYSALNFRPDWSFDRKSLIYISNRTERFEIYRVYLDDTLGQISPHKKLTDSNDVLNIYCYPSFSPDGTKILYTSSRSGNEEIWTMDSSGSNKIRITNTNASRTRRPRFSPDGNTIAFFSSLWLNGSDSLQIYTISPNGTGLDTVTTDGNCYDPSWKYDGQKIIFAKNTKPGKSYIYIIDRDGNNEVRLIDDSKSYYPVWRPNRFIL